MRRVRLGGREGVVEAAGSDQSRKELARNRTRPAGMRARDVSTQGSLPQSARVVRPSRSVLARFRLHGTKPHQQSDGRWCAQTSACCSTRRKARERASTHTRPGSHSHIPLCHTQSASRSSEALSANLSPWTVVWTTTSFSSSCWTCCMFYLAIAHARKRSYWPWHHCRRLLSIPRHRKL